MKERRFQSPAATPVRTILACVAATSTLLVTAPRARIIHVPSETGTIQAGIDLAIPPDTVLVEDGTYHECINFRGKEIVVASRYLVDSDSAHIANTIVDAGTPPGTRPDTASVVCFVHGETADARLVGFTLQNGTGTVYGTSGNRQGGGILCLHSSPSIVACIIRNNSVVPVGGGMLCDNFSSPTVTDCVFGGNHASSSGGGCRIANTGHPTFSGCSFLGNSSSYGGGLECGYAAVTIDGCRFEGNTGVNGGAVIIEYETTAQIRDSVFLRNRASSGGGIYHQDGTLTMERCLIAANEATGLGSGGGMVCGNRATLTKCTFTDNEASTRAGGIYLRMSAALTLTNTILWNNRAAEIYIQDGWVAATYCDIRGGWAGTGNIDCDPDFCDPLQDDFSISSVSCCAGAGQSGADIGAYGVGCTTPADVEPTGQRSRPGVVLYPCFPNPFRASTVIAYSLLEDAHVRLEALDVLGRSVAVLVDGDEGAGFHRVDWDASRLSAGIYLVRVTTAGEVLAGRLAIVR